MGGDNGGRRGKGYQGTSMKDIWTTSKVVGLRVGGGDGWGGGHSGGQWRQLYLNINKKRKIQDK